MVKDEAWMAGTSPAITKSENFREASRNNFICDVGTTQPRSSCGRSKQRNLRMSKISPCLWFDGEAEEAAKFYVSLLPDSRIDHIQRNPIDSPGGKTGTVLVVSFTLAGQE